MFWKAICVPSSRVMVPAASSLRVLVLPSSDVSLPVVRLTVQPEPTDELSAFCRVMLSVQPPAAPPSMMSLPSPSPTMKLSLPALPVLQSVFHTNQDAIKLSVALFFICYACSQLVWGVFGESSGRRHPLLLGLFISIIGTVMVIFSNTISLYIIGHCIEGIGVGAMSPLTFPMS